MQRQTWHVHTCATHVTLGTCTVTQRNGIGKVIGNTCMHKKRGKRIKTHSSLRTLQATYGLSSAHRVATLSGGELHRNGSFRAGAAQGECGGPRGEALGTPKPGCPGLFGGPPGRLGGPPGRECPLEPRGPSAMSSILIKLSSEGRNDTLSLSSEGLTSKSSGEGTHVWMVGGCSTALHKTHTHHPIRCLVVCAYLRLRGKHGTGRPSRHKRCNGANVCPACRNKASGGSKVQALH